MITIYHNPRCRKSREALNLLAEAEQPFEIIEYLNDPLTKDAMVALLKKLQLNPIELVRTNEAIWKEKFKGKDLSDNEIIEAMVHYPKLIERPIVVKGNKAVIGRPLEKVNTLL